MSMKEEAKSSTLTIQGIVFRRTIRASYASLDLVYFNKKEGKEEHVVAILQCPNSNNSDDTNTNVSPWRSNIRRKCKLGTEIELIGAWGSNGNSYASHSLETKGKEQTKCTDTNSHSNTNTITSNASTNFKNKCLAKRFQVVDTTNENYNHDNNSNFSPSSLYSSNPSIKVLQIQKLDMIQCQTIREKYYPGFDHDAKNKSKNNNQNDQEMKPINNTELSLSQRKQRKHEGQTGHGGGLGKRKQGEIIAELLIDLVSGMIDESSDNGCENNNRNNEDDGIDNESEHKDDNLMKSRFLDLSNIPSSRKNSKGNGDVNGCNEIKERNILKAIEFLNKGSGVMDVAGGSGHVSLALGLRGIKSTVIDPRETVGKLPGRDRKALKKALKKIGKVRKQGHKAIKDDAYCFEVGKENGISGKESKLNEPQNSENKILPPPPIEFSAMRAWFSKRPDGIDTEFREGRLPSSQSQLCSRISNSMVVDMKNDNDNNNAHTDIPICTICSSDGLLSSCSAIVALHPDEATGDIVEFAVKYKKPFIVVPCCVFSRLFPYRFKPQRKQQLQQNDVNGAMNSSTHKNEIVSTYDDLIEYLLDKDKNMKVTKLNFDGANLALWSQFTHK